MDLTKDFFPVSTLFFLMCNRDIEPYNWQHCRNCVFEDRNCFFKSLFTYTFSVYYIIICKTRNQLFYHFFFIFFKPTWFCNLSFFSVQVYSKTCWVLFYFYFFFGGKGGGSSLCFIRVPLR